MANFKFILDRDNKQIKIYAELSAKLDMVWKYYSEYQFLKLWQAPAGSELITKTMLFEPGGSWHYVIEDADGNKTWNKSEYIDIDPLHSITVLDSICDEEGKINSDFPVTKWTTRFEDEDGRHISVHSTIDFETNNDLQKYLELEIPDRIKQSYSKLDKELSA